MRIRTKFELFLYYKSGYFLIVKQIECVLIKIIIHNVLILVLHDLYTGSLANFTLAFYENFLKFCMQL